VANVIALAAAAAGLSRSDTLRIGIDITALQIREGRHGIGSYLRGLVRALARRDPGHELLLFGYSRPDPGLGPLPGWLRVITLPVPPLGRSRALISHQVVLPLMARRLGLRVLHVPGVSVNASMPGVPLWQSVPVVVTVHDLNPLRFPRETLPRRRHRVFYRMMLRATARAAHIVCDSHSTRRDVLSRLGVPAARVTVIPLAPDPFFTPAATPADDSPADPLLDGGYLLHVGGPLPLKNLGRLLDAMVELWTDETVSTDLACVTPTPFDPMALCPAASPYRDRIHVLESVSARRLRWLYRHAVCLAFPSLYEGFGLPVLEAMASGCPVITSSIASLPEVGGDAAVYVEPSNVASIRDALRNLIQSPRQQADLRDAGFRQVKRFSYEATADATLVVYERAGREIPGSRVSFPRRRRRG